jgi:hypothetical protein
MTRMMELPRNISNTGIVDELSFFLRPMKLKLKEFAVQEDSTRKARELGTWVSAAVRFWSCKRKCLFSMGDDRTCNAGFPFRNSP